MTYDKQISPNEFIRAIIKRLKEAVQDGNRNAAWSALQDYRFSQFDEIEYQTNLLMEFEAIEQAVAEQFPDIDSYQL